MPSPMKSRRVDIRVAIAQSSKTIRLVQFLIHVHVTLCYMKVLHAIICFAMLLYLSCSLQWIIFQIKGTHLYILFAIEYLLFSDFFLKRFFFLLVFSAA